MSNEDEKPEGGVEEAQARREDRSEAEERKKTGREERVYSGKCMGVG